jgi:hypothetical protein
MDASERNEGRTHELQTMHPAGGAMRQTRERVTTGSSEPENGQRACRVDGTRKATDVTGRPSGPRIASARRPHASARLARGPNPTDLTARQARRPDRGLPPRRGGENHPALPRGFAAGPGPADDDGHDDACNHNRRTTTSTHRPLIGHQHLLERVTMVRAPQRCPLRDELAGPSLTDEATPDDPLRHPPSHDESAPTWAA